MLDPSAEFARLHKSAIELRETVGDNVRELKTAIESCKVTCQRSFQLRHQIVRESFQNVCLWDASAFAQRIRSCEFHGDLCDELDNLSEDQLHALARVLNRMSGKHSKLRNVEFGRAAGI